jgi:hypothetical protein
MLKWTDEWGEILDSLIGGKSEDSFDNNSSCK